MLQQDQPKDYVIATGKQESVRGFIELAAFKLGWGNTPKSSIKWEGEGLNEVGINPKTQKIVVQIDKRYFRPTEVDTLLGDSSKARKEIGWSSKTTLEELVNEMIENDLRLAKDELKLLGTKRLDID